MKLDKETLLEGAKKSIENAQELIEEGKLLFDNDKFSRAFTLFQLSIEEVGKSFLILEAILFCKYKSETQQKVLLKKMRDHKNKTKVAQRIDFMLALSINDKEMKKVLINNMSKQSSQINKINDFKNYSLYVSLIKHQFVKPSEKISKTLADDFKFYAEIRCEATRQLLDSLNTNLDETVKCFKEMDSENMLENPPEEIKELISLVEE